MTDLALKEEGIDLRKAELERFMGIQETFCETEKTPDGLITMLNDEEIPIHPESYLVTLVQPGKVKTDAKYKTEKGKFFIEGMDEGFEELTLIPITVFGRGRTMYEGTYKEGEKSKRACFSYNGVTPSPYVVGPPAPACAELTTAKDGTPYLKATCPMAVWTDGNKPACGDYVNVAFLAVELNCTPVHFQFQRTSMSAFREFQAMYTKKKNAVRIRKQSIYDYSVKATVSDEGTYFKPAFELVHAPELNLKQYLPICNYYLVNLYKELAMKMEAEDTTPAIGANAIIDNSAEAAMEPAIDAEVIASTSNEPEEEFVV